MLDKLISKTFNSNDTWVCPAGVTSILVFGMCGGQGGSAGTYTSSTSIGGAGGCASALLPYPLIVVPGREYAIYIGAGGNGGTDSPGDHRGKAGGDTYIYDTVSSTDVLRYEAPPDFTDPGAGSTDSPFNGTFWKAPEGFLNSSAGIPGAGGYGGYSPIQGQPGSASYYPERASAGLGIGGGGGATGELLGGTGGNGAQTTGNLTDNGLPGQDAPDNSGAGGGGGGGCLSGGTGGAGGKGGSGKLIIMWAE